MKLRGHSSMNLHGYSTDGVWKRVSKESKPTFTQLNRQHLRANAERRANPVKKGRAKLTQDELDIQIEEFKKQGGIITVIKSKFPDGIARKPIRRVTEQPTEPKKKEKKSKYGLSY